MGGGFNLYAQPSSVASASSASSSSSLSASSSPYYNPDSLSVGTGFREESSSHGSSSREYRERIMAPIALKTNSLGLCLLMANLGVEVGLSRHLSFHVPVYYSGVDYFSERVKFRTLALQPELRWNFGRPRGLFIGAHATAAFFNVAAGGDYRYQDCGSDKPLLGGGLGLGYRLRFGSRSRWGVEFALGGGACLIRYDRFVNEKNGPYVDTKNRTYIGVDNVAVSLFYEFGRRRGGRR